MKKIITTALHLVIALSLFAQEKETDVHSEIKAATVFLNGAQVTREATVTLEQGNNTLSFKDLSYQINASSVQIQGNKQFTILSVNHKVNYLSQLEVPKEVTELEERIRGEEFKLEVRKNLREVYEEEQKMILANKSIKGNQSSMDVEDLEALADFYREKLKEIQYKLIDVKRDEDNISQKRNELVQQLQILRASRNKPSSEVVVKVTADQRVNVTMRISYMVHDAGWEPNYDIRSEDITGPIELTYKGKVYQNTGHDWKDINITLSTGNPTLSGVKPEVIAWELSFNSIYDYKLDNRRLSMFKTKQLNSSNRLYDMDEAMEKAPAGKFEKDQLYRDESKSIANFTNVSQGSVNTEFKIKVPYSIPSDGNLYDVEIQKHDLPVNYTYFAAPKFDKDAFLVAQVSGWDEYNLLSGFSNTYYQGTYVGKSFLNTNTTNDTLELSLGRDKGLVVDRKKTRDFTKNAGSSKKVTMGLEINLRNNKKKTVIVNLEDQIPISDTKDIVVELVESSGAEHNEETGKLKWKVILGPGEARTYKFSYTVKYPKDKTLTNL